MGRLGMRLDWDAAAVILYRDRAIGVDTDQNEVTDACHRFVDTVINYLCDKVMQSADVGAADIHARPLTNRLKPFKDLDIFSGIIVCLSYSCHTFSPFLLDMRCAI